MQKNDRYVINSTDTLYYLPNSTCSEGSQVNLRNQNVIRYRLIGDRWISSDNVSVGNYNDSYYICHIWQSEDTYQLTVGSVLLPASIFCIGLFWFLYKMLWGARR